MGNERYNALKRHLARSLVSALRAAGFVQLDLDEEDRRAAEIRAAFPFGRFRRQVPGGYLQVEVQIDKWRHDAFRLNFGVVPSGGIEHAMGHVNAEDVWVHYMDQYRELYDSSVTRRWFALSRDCKGAELERCARQLVERAVALLPELEEVVRTGRTRLLGGHVRLAH